MNHTTVEITVTTLTQLTQLVAAHGIYAIFVFFLFYLQRRASSDVADAKTDQVREFFEKKYSLVLYSIVVGAIVVSAVWIWTNFLYHDKIAIEGSLEGLPRETSQPVAQGGRSISARVAAVGNVKFYTHEKSSDLGADTTEMNWVLVAQRDDSESLELKLQHSCWFFPSERRVAVVIGSPGEDPVPKPQLTTSPLKTVRIDLKAFQALAKKRIELFYNPDKDEPCKNVGTISIVSEKGLIPLPWLTETAAPGPVAQTVGPSIFGVTPAWAETLDKSAPPKLTSDVMGHLPEQLASHDLEKQLAAQRVLVDSGAESFRFIEEQLKPEAVKTFIDRTLLVQSLEAAVEKMETSKIMVPHGLQFALAKALYEIGDYKRSSERFDKIPFSELTPQLLLLRGAADTYVGKYDRAVTSFEAYSRGATKPKERSVALGDIGSVRLQQGQNNLARKALTEALALDATNKAARINLGRLELREEHYDTAAAIFTDLLRTNPERVDLKVNLSRAYEKSHREDAAIKLLEGALASSPGDVTVLNNLAYLYAWKGIHLDRALAYADQALKGSPENVAFLDTKAWVLFRLGQLSESLKLLLRAESKDPQNTEIRGHLAEVRRAVARAQATQHKPAAG